MTVHRLDFIDSIANLTFSIFFPQKKRRSHAQASIKIIIRFMKKKNQKIARKVKKNPEVEQSKCLLVDEDARPINWLSATTVV